MTWPKPFDYEFDASGDPVQSKPFNPDDVPFFHSNTSYLYFTSALDHMYTSTLLPRISDNNYINIYYTALGDINSSYVPTSDGFKAETTIDLVFEGKRFVQKGDVVEIPVMIDRAVDLGAVTLGLSYRKDLLEIVGVDYEVHAIDTLQGLIKMAWSDMDAVYLGSRDTLALIRAVVLDNISVDTRYLQLLPVTELADPKARILGDYALIADAITTETLADELYMVQYPNPFRGSTSISYVLPESGKVSLQLFNNMGQLVEVLADQYQEQGVHRLEYSGERLQPGVYTLRLTLTGKQGQYIKSNKIIRVQ